MMISRYYIEDWWVTQTAFSPHISLSAFRNSEFYP